jgi:hypothetical protein
MRDAAGDAPAGYVDIVGAQVLQVDPATLQFDLTVVSEIPARPSSSEGNLILKWFIDADENESTGWRRRFVGAEYAVAVRCTRGHWFASLESYKGGSREDLPFLVSQGRASAVVRRCQIGNPQAFRWEPEAFTDRSGGDLADQAASARVTVSPPPPGAITRVRITPSMLLLKDGVTSGMLRVGAFDDRGAPVSLAAHDVAFFSSNPNVSVNSAGVATGRLGDAHVVATVDGIMSDNMSFVSAGRVELIPPVLFLSMMRQPTGAVAVKLTNSAGEPEPPGGHLVSFAARPPEVLQVTDSGAVTALRPPRQGEAGTVEAWVDGTRAANEASVRVTSDDLGLQLLSLLGSRVAFHIPRRVGAFDYERILSGYDVVRVTDLAYHFAEQLTGAKPFGGATLHFVTDPGHGADGTVPAGLAGNPIRLGTDVDKAVHNSALIVAWGEGAPQWAMYFHEMGHAFLSGGGWSQFLFGSDAPNSQFSYSEGLASAVAMYAVGALEAQRDVLRISHTILNQMLPVYHFESTPDLDRYVAGGADYRLLNPSVVYDIVLKLRQECGPDGVYRLFGALSGGGDPYPFDIVNDGEQATFFAAAVSAAAGADWRPRLRDAWGYPIDDAYFARIYPWVASAATR